MHAANMSHLVVLPRCCKCTIDTAQDLSDIQWRTIRGSMPALAAVFFVHAVVSNVVREHMCVGEHHLCIPKYTIFMYTKVHHLHVYQTGCTLCTPPVAINPCCVWHAVYRCVGWSCGCCVNHLKAHMTSLFRTHVLVQNPHIAYTCTSASVVVLVKKRHYL